MNRITTTTATASGLIVAAVERGRTAPDDSTFALAVHLLRQRPDVRAKLAELSERELARGRR